MEQHDCIIIGSGPAGYTAAIYAARADLKPLMYMGLQPGGSLPQQSEVDNFPGYPQGVDGNAMMEDLKNQAERFGTEVRFGLVTKAELNSEEGGYHTLTIDESTQIQARTVIISTGASAKYLGLPAEENSWALALVHVPFVTVSFTKDKRLLLSVQEIPQLRKLPTSQSSVQR